MITITALTAPTTLQMFAIANNVRNFLSSTKTVYHTDKPKSMKELLAELAAYIAQSNTYNKFRTPEDAKAGLLKYLGIASPADMSELLTKYKSQLLKAKYNLKQIRYPKSSVKKTGVKGYTSRAGLDAERTVAVRSKLGGTPVMYYPIKGTMSATKNQAVNDIKMQYHYDTGCNYYEARPILLSTWLNLPDCRKYSTCDVEVVEKQIFD